jgi:serine/threonine protein kinase
MITTGMTAKLADFGISMVKSRKERKEEGGVVGTPQYIAPEIFTPPANYSEKSDVYSFGMMCYELVAGKTPFSGTIPTFKVPDAVMKGTRPDIPTDADPRLVALIKACWSQDPNERPRFSVIVETLGEMLSKTVLPSDPAKSRIIEADILDKFMNSRIHKAEKLMLTV